MAKYGSVVSCLNIASIGDFEWCMEMAGNGFQVSGEVGLKVILEIFKDR